MDDLEWPRVVYRVLTQRWSQLKNTLVMKDFVDHLIQKRVVTLDYWMGLKAKQITESERTEDFLALVMKLDQPKYQYFLEALLSIHREDLVRDLLNAQNGISRKKEKISDRQLAGTPKVNRTRAGQGQTDVDKETRPSNPQKPSQFRPIYPKNSKDGCQEAFITDGQMSKPEKTLVNQSEASNHMDKPEKLVDSSKQESFSKMSKTDKLHHGIGTAVKEETKSSASKSPETDTKNQPKTGHEQQSNSLITESTKTHPGETDGDSVKESDSIQTLRPDTTKSKRESLEIRERQLKSRESELEKNQKQLMEKEEQLKLKENELITRENSLLTIRPRTSESLSSPSKLLKDMQQLNTVSFYSTTESSDVLADVREQLAAMKKVTEEIESEHTTYCNTPKDDYVKLQDFVIAQQNIEELKDQVTTGRMERKDIEERVTTLQCKVEDLNLTINELQNNIDTLKVEKEKTKIQLSNEISQLRQESKNRNMFYNEKFKKLETQMQAKDDECVELKSNVEDIVKTATELEERVEVLENEKNRQEQEIKEYQKEISFLKKELHEKEAEINDIKKVLEETENEKEELIEVLTGLKRDVSSLKAEKRQLEHDKRTLLGRCAKPQWNSSGRRTTFK